MERSTTSRPIEAVLGCRKDRSSSEEARGRARDLKDSLRERNQLVTSFKQIPKTMNVRSKFSPIEHNHTYRSSRTTSGRDEWLRKKDREM